MAAGGEDDVPVPPKRSLFKKSAWAKPVEGEDVVHLFSRSKEIFPDVVAENERQRKELERSRSKVSAEHTDDKVQKNKRRRISKDSNDREVVSEEEVTASRLRGRGTSSTATPQSPTGGPTLMTSMQTVSPGKPSGSKKTSPTQKTSGRSRDTQASAITKSDSEDNFVRNAKDAKALVFNFDDSEDEMEVLKPPRPVEPLVDTFEEEEEEKYPEYVARAREGARRKVFERLDPTKSNARSDISSDSQGVPKPESTGPIRLVEFQSPAFDPIVQILITSCIEGTKPLILKRKLSQRLKDVRLGWCDRQLVNGQPLSDSMKRQIFLTWRGNKVFDVTTCQAMGLKVDARGGIRSDGDGFDTHGRIQLEAWTDEVFDEYKKQKAAEKKRRDLSHMEDEELPELQEFTAKEEVQRLKLILKSKDYKEFKLLITPTTTIAKMISVFRQQYKIPATTEISFHLDGNQIDPGIVVGNADVDDMTTIDVHVG